MSSRSRVLLFGSSGVLVIAGVICAGLIHGLIGQLLTIVLISLGLGGAVLLVFLEVGLSEDRERAREETARRERPKGRGGATAGAGWHRPRWRRRPS